MKFVLLFVTKNEHKVLEVRQIIKMLNAESIVEVRPYNLPKIEIQSNDLAEIALHAARYAYDKSHLKEYPVVVEDAGLFIEALNGFPGPYSSYVYKTIGIRGVLKLMEGVENRCAYFLSAVAIVHSELGERVFVGRVDGSIAHEARGTKGFGFDPIFIPEGCDKTFAEMNINEKCLYSHRSKAFRKLIEWLVSKA